MKNFLLLTPMLFLANMLLAQMQLSLETLATGFDHPLDIANCGDERLFIVEQKGIIKILMPDGTVLPTPFLDIENQVNDVENEQGLLGLTFHPDYLDNGLFYVNYNIPGLDSRVSQFSVSAADPNVADISSEEILLTVDQPFWNHNGGCLKFGPDGYLYAGFGDGGSGGDPQGNGQKRTTMLAKMLRLDVDGGSPYAIPPGNPFVDEPSALDEIWALGLRNPWRFSFDRVTGDLWIGDVGQNAWEEIDFQPADSEGGENYGWRCYEGDHVYNNSGCAAMSTMVFPVMEYENGFVDCSVTGGFVYRGCEFPQMYGHYIFGDFCSGHIWRISPDGNGGWENEQLADFGDLQVAAFGENMDGELFVSLHGNGQIAKIVATGNLLEPTDETCIGMGNGTINFTIPTDQFATIIWSDGATDANRTGLSPGEYGVTVTTVNGCEFISSAEVMEGIIVVPPDISLSMDSILIADAGGTNYQWFLDGTLIPGANENIYIAQENGLYNVEYDLGDCHLQVSIMVTNIMTGLLETLGLNSFLLTPNPFDGALLFQVSASQNMDLEVTMTNMNGKVFLQEKNKINGSFAKTFDLSDLPPGIYFFTMKTPYGEWSEKVVRN